MRKRSGLKDVKFGSTALAAIGLAIIALAIFLQGQTTIPAWQASSPLELSTDLVAFLCLAWACVRAVSGIQQGESRASWIGIVVASAVFFVGQVSDLLLSANALINEEWFDDQAGYKLAIAAAAVIGSLACKSYLPTQSATRRWLMVAGAAFAVSTLVESLNDIEDYLFTAHWSPLLKTAIWGTRTAPYFSESNVGVVAEALELLALIAIFASVILVDLAPTAAPHGAASNRQRAAGLGRLPALGRYTLWRAFHPGAGFSDYYIATVERTLQRKGRHPALIIEQTPSSRQFGPVFTRMAKDVVRHMFDLGLSARHRVLDYGCGSLRLGRLLIPALDRGNYLGLDVTERFYTAGLASIDARLLADKQPHLRVIAPATIADAAATPPDFLLSFAVLQHVPPTELDAFFGNIVRLIGARTTALISFRNAEIDGRYRNASWAYTPGELLQCLQRTGLRQPVKLVPPSAVFSPDGKRAIWFLQIGPDSLANRPTAIERGFTDRAEALP